MNEVGLWEAMDLHEIDELIDSERGREERMPAMLTVNEWHRGDWQAAQIRAQEERLQIGHLKMPGGPAAMHTFGVSSGTHPGKLTYQVDVDTNWRGWTQVRCACPAGSMGRPCKHAALAMTELKVWPFPIGIQTEAAI